MNQKLINAFVFVTGAAIGSLVTWRLMKSHYEQYIRDEIDNFVADWKGRVPHPNIRDDEGNWNDLERDEVDEEDDSNETEIYEYPGHGIDHTIYVTNSLG